MPPKNPRNPADSVGDLVKSGVYGWKDSKGLIEKMKEEVKARRDSASSLESGVISDRSKLSKKGKEGIEKKTEKKRAADGAKGKAKEEIKEKNAAVEEDDEASAKKKTKRTKKPSPPRALFSDDEDEKSPKQPPPKQPDPKYPDMRRPASKSPTGRRAKYKTAPTKEISPTVRANAEKYLAAVLKIREQVESNNLNKGRLTKGPSGNCQDRWKLASQQLLQAHFSLTGIIEAGRPAEGQTPGQALVEAKAPKHKPTSRDLQPAARGKETDGPNKHAPASPKHNQELSGPGCKPSSPSQEADGTDKSALTSPKPGQDLSGQGYKPTAPGEEADGTNKYAPTSPKPNHEIWGPGYEPTSPSKEADGTSKYVPTSPKPDHGFSGPGYRPSPSLPANELAKHLGYENLELVTEAERLELEKMRARQKNASEDKAGDDGKVVDDEDTTATAGPASGSSTPGNVPPPPPVLGWEEPQTPPSSLPVDQDGNIEAPTPGGFLSDNGDIDEAAEDLEADTARAVPSVTVEDVDEESPTTQQLHDIFDRIDQMQSTSQSPQPTGLERDAVDFSRTEQEHDDAALEKHSENILDAVNDDEATPPADQRLVQPKNDGGTAASPPSAGESYERSIAFQQEVDGYILDLRSWLAADRFVKAVEWFRRGSYELIIDGGKFHIRHQSSPSLYPASEVLLRMDERARSEVLARVREILLLK